MDVFIVSLLVAAIRADLNTTLHAYRTDDDGRNSGVTMGAPTTSLACLYRYHVSVPSARSETQPTTCLCLLCNV